jgi:hypothetical protein
LQDWINPSERALRSLRESCRPQKSLPFQRPGGVAPGFFFGRSSHAINEAFLCQLSGQQRGISVFLTPNDNLVRPIAILGSSLSRPAFTHLALEGDTEFGQVPNCRTLMSAKKAVALAEKANLVCRGATFIAWDDRPSTWCKRPGDEEPGWDRFCLLSHKYAHNDAQ